MAGPPTSVEFSLVDLNFQEVYPVVTTPGELDVFVPPKPHADQKHAEAPAVRDFFLNGKCNPADLKEFQGNGEMDRFRLWACEKGKNVLVYIAIKVTEAELSQGFKPWREVTCFISPGWNYVRNLVLNEIYSGPY